MQANAPFAMLLTLFAGLATGIGSLLALFTKRSNKTFLSFSLGLSAGVMIYVSFVEILAKAREHLDAGMGEALGGWLTAASFFGGILVILVIDFCIPDAENPHTPHTVDDMVKPVTEESRLLRMGLLSALAITIHNFPEGMATFAAALADPHIGISIAVAIAIHNIPEGISVSIPIFYATGSRRKAFWWSFLSGLSEPLGALIGYLLLRSFLSDTTLGLLFGSVAGVMVYVSLDELLPAAREYGKGHTAIVGVIAGMAVMAVSLLLFE